MSLLNLERRDYFAIAVAMLFGLLGGIAGHILSWEVQIENSIRIATGLAILLGLFALYRNVPGKKGSYARNLEMIGIGTGFFLVSWIPHIGWHMGENAALLGLSEGFWTGLFHTWNAVSFLIIAYGMYLFYRATKSERDEDFVENGFLNLHLTAEDYQFLMFTGWTILLGAIVGQIVGFSPAFEWATTMIQVPFILAALYFIYRNNVWQGDIGRNLSLVGVGLLIIMIDYIFHIPWHLMDNPAWGISTGFWVGLFHLWITGGFLLIAYAFNEL
jgi:hypothetical protein